MATTLTQSNRHLKEAENTYHLPAGEAIRRELVKWFRLQRKAVMTWVKTGEIETKNGSRSTEILGDVGGSDHWHLDRSRLDRSESELLTKKEREIPGVMPLWDAFGLGVLPMSERMTPKLEAIWDTAGQKFTSQIGLDPDAWEVTNPKIQDAINEAALDFCAETNATTSLTIDDAIAAVRKALSIGVIEKGEGVRELTKRVSKIFDGGEKFRARRIATTEASRAVHSAQEMQAEDSEIVVGWRWLISANSCEICKTIARQAPAVKLGQPFAIIGNNPTYSEIRFPPAHPNCRCSCNAITIYDEQPDWANTLDQPEPEEEDYKPESLPGLRQPELAEPSGVKPRPEVIAKPRPARVAKPIPAAPIKPRETKPSGTPVSGGLDVHIKSPVSDRHVKATIDIIDKVHGDGRLPKLPIVDTKTGTNLGVMKVDPSTLKPIGIVIHNAGDTPRVTAAHEIGHFLDWSGIKAPNRTAVGGIDYRKDPRFRGLLGAVDKSEAITSLRELKTKPIIESEGKRYKVDHKYVQYLASDEEVWARAYSQYIAVKSQDPTMMAEIEHIRRFGPDTLYHTQWNDEDFKPIAREFDKLFRVLGWIK